MSASNTHATVSREDPFILTAQGLVPVRSISYVDLGEVEKLRIILHHEKGRDTVEGFFAVEALMLLKPSAMEGKRLRWARRAWTMHNVIGHPVLEFMACAASLVRPFAPELARRITHKAIYVHDITAPRPTGTRDKPAVPVSPADPAPS